MSIRLAGLLLIGAASTTVPYAAVAQSVDLMEGRVVKEVRVSGLRHSSPDVVEQNLATRAGEPFRHATMALDQRRLD